MKPARAIAALLLAATAAIPAFATDIPLPADGSWVAFSVDALRAPIATPLAWIGDAGLPLAFTFSIGAGLTGVLTVVDAGFAGDTFRVTDSGSALGATSLVPPGSYEASPDIGLDYGGALADDRFSRGVFALGAGSYRIAGTLAQSVTFAGLPLEATAGAVRLLIAPVPEPQTYTLQLAGIAVIGALARRRRPHD